MQEILRVGRKRCGEVALVHWQLQQCASRMSVALQVLCTFGDELLLLRATWVWGRVAFGVDLGWNATWYWGQVSRGTKWRVRVVLNPEDNES